MGNLVIIASHLIFFGMSMLACRMRPQAAKNKWLLTAGALGLPIFGLLMLAMLDFSNHANNGTHGAWYIIFSVVTLGVIPVVTHLSAAASGVLASRIVVAVGRTNRNEK